MYFWIFALGYVLESLIPYKLPYVMVDPAMPDFVMKSHLSKVSQRLGSEKIMNIKKQAYMAYKSRLNIIAEVY